MTPQEIRNVRLKNDYLQMCNIRGPVISWRALRGTPPFVEVYRLTVNVRSIVGPGPDYRDQHLIEVELPASYPTAPPQIVMVSRPVVFHPNWWEDSRWCYGDWIISEGLGHHVVRMIRTLQYDPIITNEYSAANRAARDWYQAHEGSNLFPCDTQTLPNPERSRNETGPTVRKRFEIRG